MPYTAGVVAVSRSDSTDDSPGVAYLPFLPALIVRVASVVGPAA